MSSRSRHRSTASPGPRRPPYWTPESFYAGFWPADAPSTPAPALARAALVEKAGVVHRVLRVALRVAHLRPALRERVPVPVVDLGARRRLKLAVGERDTEGAVLASVHDLEARRRKLARMEHREPL